MQKRHIAIYLCTLLLLVTACTKTVSEPKRTIQFEIEEKGLPENEKTNVGVNIQKRLESLGATNVKLTTQDGQQFSFTYQGNIKPETLEKSFSIAGKLEFFETVRSKKEIIDYLLYGTNSDNLVTEEQSENSAFTTFSELVRLSDYRSEDGVIGSVNIKDKARLEALPLFKEPFYVDEIKKRVKFLLGRSHQENEYLVYALYVTSENKAPLDGIYVTNARAEKASYNDTYLINIQKNEEGALIWERLTERAYQERSFIAVVVDDFVYCAPGVTTGKITGGRSQISGGFTKNEAERLASVITSGTLPKIKITKMPVAKDSFPSN